MTADWRKIESAIADFLEREGLSIGRDNLADKVAGEGEYECPQCGEDIEGANSFNITKLARELADLK